MFTTEEFAKLHGISVQTSPPVVEAGAKHGVRSRREIAVRILILHGIVAVAAGVDPEPVAEWFQNQKIWSAATPKEKAFLQNATASSEQRNQLVWHNEAEWALLWMVGKVESLGLPTGACDTRRLVDEIIPPLGSDIGPFLRSAKLRSPGMLLAEDDRTYNLWCYVHAARRKSEPVPEDLNLGVLYERRYAFEWLDGFQEWDDVICDA